jgi:hypothetical protein
MRRHLLRLLAVPGLLLLFAPGARAQEETESQTGKRFICYPTFRPRFHHATEQFTLIANIHCINASTNSVRDVTFRQAFPPELRIRLAPEDIAAQLVNPPEFWQKIEENTYVMFEPRVTRRTAAAIIVEIPLERRMGSFTIPGTQIEFTGPDGPEKEQTNPVTIDVTEYANHVGDLDRFLRRLADVGLDVSVSGRDGWEFAPIDSVALGRNPEGIIGIVTSDNGYSGHYRLHHGPPGDSLDILVVWKQTRKDEAIADEAAARGELGEYLKWTGPFKFDEENSKVSKGKFKKYDAWILEGRWIDTVPKRLGSGPVRAIAFYSGREDVEYHLIFQAQGRGLGPEKSETPAPEKEQELLATLEKILKTFRSEIDPISYKR